jgi:hypothetical protein
MGLLVAVSAVIALIVMLVCWVIGKRVRLRWRLLTVLVFVVGIVIMYVGA